MYIYTQDCPSLWVLQWFGCYQITRHRNVVSDFYSAYFLDIEAVYNTSDTKINIINNEYQMISRFKASRKINDYL